MDPWAPGVRALDVPIVNGGVPNSLDTAVFRDEDKPLCPNRSDISRHLYALFPPEFVKAYPDAWIEIAIATKATDWKPEAAEHFSPFNLPKAIDYAEKANKAGKNVYVGPSLRQGTTGPSGRSKGPNFLASVYSLVRPRWRRRLRPGQQHPEGQHTTERHAGGDRNGAA